MNNLVTIKLHPKAAEFIHRFGITQELAKLIAAAIDTSNQISVDEIKAKLSGPVLKRRTGRLRDSIGRTFAIITGLGASLKISSAVGSGVSSGQQAVRYAAIHEFGGVIKAHTVYAKNARALRFQMNGRTIFAKSVHIPDVHMPERSYLRSTIKERLPKYSNRVSRAILGYWSGKGDNV